VHPGAAAGRSLFWLVAVDHRHLHKGAARKTLHSLARCALLYLNVMPDRWQESDWGYWSS
jgi:hypothetical protein